MLVVMVFLLKILNIYLNLFIKYILFKVRLLYYFRDGDYIYLILIDIGYKVLLELLDFKKKLF